jgi:hypothetical protein
VAHVHRLEQPVVAAHCSCKGTKVSNTVISRREEGVRPVRAAGRAPAGCRCAGKLRTPGLCGTASSVGGVLCLSLVTSASHASLKSRCLP